MAPQTVAWGHAVKEVQRAADGRWCVDFIGQPSVTADLVVGADGVGSRVRPHLTQVSPTSIGMTMLAAVIRKELWRGSELADLLGEGSVMFAEHHQTIFVQRCNRDLILVYYSMVLPPDWPKSAGFVLGNGQEVLAAISAAYSAWPPELIRMLTQVDGKFHSWPLSVMPPNYVWQTQTGLAMIGDASHAMPPFTGKGVNLALLDALELADALVADPNAATTDAIRGCEVSMQQRTSQEITACLEVGRQIYGIEVSFSDAYLNYTDRD